MLGAGEPRAARPGDVCVLVEPTGDDVVELRHQQRELQRVFGGRIHEPVHLTVQRFRLGHGRPRQDLVGYLLAELGALRPFSVVAVSLAQMEHPFWESQLIRWRVPATADLRAFCGAVEGLLVEKEIVPHFPLERGWEPRYVTALEETGAGELDRCREELRFPCRLFEAQRVVLSRIEAQRTFRTLGESGLGGR
ncbi:MAG: hypothetical protein U9R72_16730 [Chloroflexota bacterium]|nr:hypothetical protein [Chloroflexota bacterium]